MNIIKNIIFDLGGVLLDIDYHLTIAAFERLGISNFKEMFTQFKADEFFEGVETGKVSETAFYEKMHALIPGPVTDAEIDAAWNAMIIGFRKDALPVLRELAKDHRLFLLSNTNAIHLKEINRVFSRDTGADALDMYFTKSWYSHLAGLRKPYQPVFEYVLADAGLEAAETLFIDDTIDNIETARRLGIRTWHMVAGESVATIQDHLISSNSI